MDNIRAVIFDLGRVLIDFDYLSGVKRISRFCDKTPQEITSLFFNSPLTNSFEEGKISPGIFFKEVKTVLGLRIGFKEFLPIWNEIFYMTEENKKTFHLAGDLKNNYKLALLSNVNILHLDYIKKEFPVFDIFDPILASCELGLIKPDYRIYQQAINALECQPAEIFYTDDREELIDAAKKFGLRGFVYKGFEQLKYDLISCGVKSN
ncbi:MAG: HAD family phosphatase [Candidatus Omnitrophota bacterium]|nr:HAD family phosphatase [Candidatus Omnitrophota bacterium]MBU1928299.1 HAD family phosphatase [Candidatus Omnitrophota bacterium]MBU2035545.1 HAD family phosphatase [Candidatus Omnitrophota bacterium]MBU2222012.1 HAD family phosphatase [Candidatus Omnitrophota bacterium]MBU2257881.1 HAD family phosphatase [Candidatus Omnitrophota bacterium]